MKKINLIIPMNGLGTRFRDDGYEMPKPLINVLGKPMIFWLLDNLNLSKIENIIIPYTNLLDNFNFQSQIRDRYKTSNIKFISLNHPTRGAAETVQVALSDLGSEDMKSNVMLMDCDTFYFEDVVTKYIESKYENNIFYFKDENDKAIFSYIKTENDIVKEIAEKEKISDLANCGIYCFKSGLELKSYCDKLLKNANTGHELYISAIYKLMLSDEVAVGSTQVLSSHCVGTPLQLKIFCENNNENVTSQRFCFDLDNTLVTKPLIDGDYTSVGPIVENINFLKYLKSIGHYIIISTARRMRTHEGNQGKVVRDIGLITLQTLKDLDIPYDEIHFAKPWANFYIDDLAVNCNLNLEKQIGFYNSHIKSRKFNKIEILNNLVIKTGSIDGEKYYYKEIEKYPQISSLFPKMVEGDENKIIIEKANGINLSYLYCNNNLTTNNFRAFIDKIRQLHSIPGQETNLFSGIAIKEKMSERYRSYNYNQFNNSNAIFENIMDFLRAYHLKERKTSIIHGDPVFTNAIVDNNNDIKLIDMRGKVGDAYTIFGDPIYDISKIYQSISGYDFILNNKVNYGNNQEILKIFKEWVEENYDYTMEEIKKYTASLYFSLIPLHDNDKCEQYFLMAKSLLQQGE